VDRERFERFIMETVGGSLTCKEFVELVTDYLEESLSFGRWVRFQLHLAVCPDCHAYLRQMNETVRRLGTLRKIQPPAPVRRELQRRFRDWVASRVDG
jgi:predicted anti-sigma-YlaC factor YlaD